MISLPSELSGRVHGKRCCSPSENTGLQFRPLQELESLKNIQHSNRTLHSTPGKQQVKGKGRIRAAAVSGTGTFSTALNPARAQEHIWSRDDEQGKQIWWEQAGTTRPQRAELGWRKPSTPEKPPGPASVSSKIKHTQTQGRRWARFWGSSHSSENSVLLEPPTSRWRQLKKPWTFPFPRKKGRRQLQPPHFQHSHSFFAVSQTFDKVLVEKASQFFQTMPAVAIADQSRRTADSSHTDLAHRIFTATELQTCTQNKCQNIWCCTAISE